MALALGLGAGFGAAYVLERLDDKIRSVEQLELVSGLSTLGVIPKVSQCRRGDRRSPLRSERGVPLAVHRVAVRDRSGPATNVIITSSGPAEGKSLTSIAMAKHFASLGRKVLLVDADMRNPSLHKAQRRQLDGAQQLSHRRLHAA